MTKLFNRTPQRDEDLTSDVAAHAELESDHDKVDDRALLPGDLLTEIYKRGKQEWDDRWGDAISQRDSWKKYAVGSLIVLAISVAGNVWQGTQSKIEIVPIERDKNLDVVGVRTVGAKPVGDVAYIAADLKRWIRNVRTVYADANALKKGIVDAYRMVSKNSPANLKLNEIFLKEDVFERAKRETVFVTPMSAIPNSDNTPDSEGRITWRLEWQEQVNGRDGALIRSELWTATVTFLLNDPENREQVEENPTGIYITHINWSRKSTQ